MGVFMSGYSRVIPTLTSNNNVQGGMTVKEHFTALALQALLARPDFGRTSNAMESAGALAAIAAESALEAIEG